MIPAVATVATAREERVAQAARPAVRARRPVGRATFVVLIALAIFSIGPIVLTFFNALKTQPELAANPLGLPAQWQWSNFVTAWVDANMAAGLANSVVVVLGSVALICVVSLCAAYALSRLKVRGGTGFMSYLLVSSSLPTQMFLVPLFYLWTGLGLYDTLLGLILIYAGIYSPFATLLLRSFMIALPPELEEAARIDGAGELRILLRIVLPNALPGVLTIALVTGLSAYNEFLFAVTFIQSSELMPLSTTFFSFQQGYTQDFTLISAAGLIMIAPMLVLFLALQRRFIEGLSASGMGGM
ncbi:carbohydrate ABC transporter permease [Microbacterium algeriense]|uniref:carbohydrate ABC transporter permease n=1 Tax=Microbacterium algeriense TaxID=2615184 RepID=UPI0022DFB006|nr:carbohydrate ABC transporter permease [Microbacterium algeriense]